MRPTRWRRSTHAIVGIVVLASGGRRRGGGGDTDRSDHGTSRAQTLPAPPAAAARPSIVPVPDTAPMPTSDGLAATLAAVANDPNLGVFGGRISDAVTARQLWQRADDLPLKPASTNKALTAAAALLALDLGARVTTKVVAAGAQPGVVVLVGGGDPTLSGAPPGQDTWYHGAARISDLADQVRRSGVTPTAVQVDTVAFSGPLWRRAGTRRHRRRRHRPIESVMLDAGRIQPATVHSPAPALPPWTPGVHWPAHWESTRTW